MWFAFFLLVVVLLFIVSGFFPGIFVCLGSGFLLLFWFCLFVFLDSTFLRVTTTLAFLVTDAAGG